MNNEKCMKYYEFFFREQGIFSSFLKCPINCFYATCCRGNEYFDVRFRWARSVHFCQNMGRTRSMREDMVGKVFAPARVGIFIWMFERWKYFSIYLLWLGMQTFNFSAKEKVSIRGVKVRRAPWLYWHNWTANVFPETILFHSSKLLSKNVKMFSFKTLLIFVPLQTWKLWRVEES